MMNKQEFILLCLWVLYCALHSILAAPRVKTAAQKMMGTQYRFYRLGYSLFAAITLILLLWYQFSIPSTPLFKSSEALDTLSLLLSVPGLYIMAVCIHKYFYHLSGIQALKKEQPVVKLQVTGLHRLVRHPLYLGTLMFIWGLFLLLPLTCHLIACVVITIYVVIGIRLEEKKLLLEYGEEYRRYAQRIPMLLPFGYRR
jgi:methanethiol S-methyltransferase